MGFISGVSAQKKKKKSAGILNFGKVPQLGFRFYHNIERKTEAILNESLLVINRKSRRQTHATFMFLLTGQQISVTESSKFLFFICMSTL